MNTERRANAATRVTVVGFFLNLLLTALKIIVGTIFSSMALVADGVHSFSDLLSDIFIIVSFQFSKKPADRTHNYGHGKIDIVAELVVGVFLILVAIGMLKGSLTTIMSASGSVFVAPSFIVLLMALISIIIKEWLYRYTMHYAKILNSRVMEANALHHRTDSFSSVAVLISLTAAKILGGSWLILDPIVAGFISIYIAKVGLEIIVASFYDLIDGALPESDIEIIMGLIAEVKEFTHPHNLRTRKLGNSVAIDVHVRAPSDMSVKDSHALTTVLEKKIRARYGEETMISIHVEPDFKE